MTTWILYPQIALTVQRRDSEQRHDSPEAGSGMYDPMQKRRNSFANAPGLPLFCIQHMH